MIASISFLLIFIISFGSYNSINAAHNKRESVKTKKTEKLLALRKNSIAHRQEAITRARQQPQKDEKKEKSKEKPKPLAEQKKEFQVITLNHLNNQAEQELKAGRRQEAIKTLDYFLQSLYAAQKLVKENKKSKNIALNPFQQHLLKEKQRYIYLIQTLNNTQELTYDEAQLLQYNRTFKQWHDMD
jgi:hypothetical protein